MSKATSKTIMIGMARARALRRKASGTPSAALGQHQGAVPGAARAVLGSFEGASLPPMRKPPRQPPGKPYRALRGDAGKAQTIFSYPTAFNQATPSSGSPSAFYEGRVPQNPPNGVPGAANGPIALVGTLVRGYTPGMRPLVDAWTKTVKSTSPTKNLWTPKPLYISEEDVARCTYCGLPADGVDHLPPQSVRQTLIDQGIARWTFVEVVCCHECNSLLGASPPWTVAQRKLRLKKLLEHRYRRYPAIPKWSDQEVEMHSVRGLLGAHIRNGLLIKQTILRRLCW